MHGHARWRQWTVAWFWFPNLQRSQDGQHCDGEGALPRWQDSKVFTVSYLKNDSFRLKWLRFELLTLIAQ